MAPKNLGIIGTCWLVASSPNLGCMSLLVQVIQRSHFDVGKVSPTYEPLNSGWAVITLSGSHSRGMLPCQSRYLHLIDVFRINNNHNKADGFERRLEVSISQPIASEF